jgi:HEAT repeat protein
MPLGKSILVARCRADERRSFEIEVFRYLTQQLTCRRVDLDLVERTLEILIAIAPLARLHGALRLALAHDEARVRSKAAVAVGRRVANVPLLQRLLTDTDARVRANTVEALWHMREPEIESIFLRSLGDAHHRTVANATYGLFLIDRVKHFPKVCELIEHPDAGSRAAGAWLLGKIREPENLRLLRPLLIEKNTDVRGAAFRALAILRALDRSSTAEIGDAA